MLKLLSLAFLAAVAASSLARAGEVSYELGSNYSLTGGARTKFGDFQDVKNGYVSEQSALFRFVASPQLTDSVLLRVGAGWQHFAFGLPEGAPLPNTLQSASLILGMDVQAFGSWLFRIEAAPGFYSASNRFDADDLNVPFILGASYIASPDLQWILGCEVNIRNVWPVLPGAGVRWKFAEKWVFNAVLPTPRLEYLMSRSLTLYGGGELKVGSYRLENRFGSEHGLRELDGAWVDYTELRAGCGAAWKVTRKLTLEAEGGVMAYRNFDYHHTAYEVENSGGAPYAQISLGGRF